MMLQHIHEDFPAGLQIRVLQKAFQFCRVCFGEGFCLCPVRPELFHIQQAGLARYPDGSSRNCFLYLEYIRTLSPELAHWVCAGKEEETWARHFEEANSLELLRQEELSSPGLDRLFHIAYQIENGEFPRNFYIGQSGCQVFVLHIQGPEPEKALNLLTERLAAEAV